MHQTSVVGGALPQKFVLLLAVGFFLLLALWITVLGTTVVSIMADTEESSADDVTTPSSPSSSSGAKSLAEVTTIATTTEAPIEVNEPITVDTIRDLKRQIRTLEKRLSSSGDREELFQAIELKASLQRQLNECEKKTKKPGPAPKGKSSPAPSSPSLQASSLESQQQQQQQQQPQHERPVDHAVAVVDDSSFPAEKSGGHVILPPSLTPGSSSSDPRADPSGTIPIIILSYNRHNDVKRLISRVSSLIAGFPYSQFPHVPRFRLVVSQDSDGLFPQVTSAIREAQQQRGGAGGVVYLSHTRDDSGATAEEAENQWEPYLAISRHYAWALATTFTKVNQKGAYSLAILLEEDLEIADDFLEYMAAMAPLFARQRAETVGEELYCVSAFNDNGKSLLVGDAHAVYRSDFFPGLGWMVSRALWERELRRKWPRGFWDDWMRQPEQRRGRSCVRPEVSRSRAICQAGEGTSGGQFCEHLSQIVLYNKFHDETHSISSTMSPWAKFNIESLMPGKYDAQQKRWLSEARVVYNVGAIDRVVKELSSSGLPVRQEVKMVYPNNDAFQVYAESFNLMADFKDGVPRTAYKGTVSFRWRGSSARPPIPPRMLPFENDINVVRVHLCSEKLLYDNGNGNAHH